MNSTLKRALSWGGSALGILGVAFVAVKLFDYGNRLPMNRIGMGQWFGIAALSLVYGASGFLLAIAWRDILRHLGVTVRRDWAAWAYGVSQLAKYVPGNVFHLAGRQALGASAGLPQWPLGKSLVWELGTIAVMAGLFVLWTIPLFLPLPVWAALVVFACAAGGSFVIIRRGFSPDLARAAGLQLVFLGLSGIIFATLFKLLGGEWNWVPVAGAYVVAWLIGLVTPGAPAGVGVREAVLFFLLRDVLGQADLLEIILIGRLVTAAGDLAFFLAASVCFSGRPTGLLVETA
jgi:uncharacterized membrane protein YbhN (UPF0104 family)